MSKYEFKVQHGARWWSYACDLALRSGMKLEEDRSPEVCIAAMTKAGSMIAFAGCELTKNTAIFEWLITNDAYGVCHRWAAVVFLLNCAEVFAAAHGKRAVMLHPCLGVRKMLARRGFVEVGGGKSSMVSPVY